MIGAASCTDILTHHGADVTTLDGAGRSALRLAKDLVLSSHPRRLDIALWFKPDREYITAQDDAETLAVVERAFNNKFQGTKTLEDYFNSDEGEFLQPPPMPDEPASILHSTFNKALTALLTPTQIDILHHRLSYLSYELRKI